ncbi:MAG: hypothetical protein Fur0037_27650 [Planctomycetota bacterium]
MLDERQSLLTAWVDGELRAEDLARFEAMMRDDPELAAEAAEHRRVANFARSLRLMEPADFEVASFDRRHRLSHLAGWALLIAGASLLAAEAAILLWSSEWSPIAKVGTSLAAAGSLLVLIHQIRRKIRARRFDRFRGNLY